MFIEFCRGFAEFVGTPFAIALGIGWVMAAVFLVWNVAEEISYLIHK